MYQVGDYLVYGMEGVCRVADVGHPKLSGVSRTQLYYTLVPVGKTDSGKTFDREEIDRILDKLSRTGINSLTPDEIAVLEKVREQMNRKN